ncbi:short-chain alcohol dehydrogenase [Acetobacter nitrogenifigens DSM 23921 = NBRC 105050]|uniref:Uncharacterized protein n=1 Tax=Acetobacter nitrogenifigens DSM 23921 = NBRC 105050 TaxID=1120919 RepID=A0A511XEN0_9PROT|nr:SDR family NAD(P)-dependent oxidoreductase [Acetobacter nitrogenifigens]GBQ96586.1 short-chain alcohol dehydrogenase [Acetobacter nitrogenifigens DSM 23921 = NBRC 105050]GEN61414.1 hypothetical protein ANI02nite_32980 [Acetobacter nitrogenifigens DSM 23921 = NBRC 105050]
MLGARRDDRLEALVESIIAEGGAALYRVIDVAGLVILALDQPGKLDVLINSAGIAPISLFDDLCVEDWEATIDVNIEGFLFGIVAALPVFRRQALGHFFNTLSTDRPSNRSDNVNLCRVEKRGQDNFRRAAQEAGPSIRMKGVSSGCVQTELPSFMTNTAM